MTKGDAKRLKLTRSLAEAHALADAVLERARAAKARTAPKRAKGIEKKRNEEERGARAYGDAKHAAFARSMQPRFGQAPSSGPRCEVTISGVRCAMPGDDPDHVIGGAHRKDCERLGAEGLMIVCRTHHDMKHAETPTRGYWLDVAQEHARYYCYTRLLSLIARARAKYEAKHPPPQSKGDTTP